MSNRFRGQVGRKDGKKLLKCKTEQTLKVLIKWIKTIQLVKIEMKPFFFRKNANFEKKWLSKLGCHANVDVHVTTPLKCFQVKFSRQVWWS